MSADRLPAGEARAALATLVTLGGLFVFADAGLGPGPLGGCAGVAGFCAAIVVPACRPQGSKRWAFLPLLLALPFLCGCSYGHGGTSLLHAFVFVATASFCGLAYRMAPSRARPYYLPSMLLLFLAPYALGYLVAEFGSGDPGAWRGLSPLEWIQTTVRSGFSPDLAWVLLWVWLIFVNVARSRRVT